MKVRNGDSKLAMSVLPKIHFIEHQVTIVLPKPRYVTYTSFLRELGETNRVQVDVEHSIHILHESAYLAPTSIRYDNIRRSKNLRVAQ